MPLGSCHPYSQKSSIAKIVRNVRLIAYITTTGVMVRRYGKRIIAVTQKGEPMDLIDRQAAIDAIRKDPMGGLNYRRILNDLPSARPEQQHGRIFQEIVVEYPSYNTYPEYKGKPYFSIKYTENGQEFIGYGTYKLEGLSEYLKEYFTPTAQPEQRWTPCSERPPEKSGDYLVTGRKGAVSKRKYDNGRWYGGWAVLAWQTLPEPYREEGGPDD
jgi:hypothetical protein